MQSVVSVRRRSSQNVNLGVIALLSRWGCRTMTGEGTALNTRWNSAKGGGSYSVSCPS